MSYYTLPEADAQLQREYLTGDGLQKGPAKGRILSVVIIAAHWTGDILLEYKGGDRFVNA